MDDRERQRLFERRQDLFDEALNRSMPLEMARRYVDEIIPIDAAQARYEARISGPLTQPRKYWQKRIGPA